MRENFTVDWEKERARLESYREINAKDYMTASAPEVKGPASPPLAIDIDDSELGFANTSTAATPTQAPARPAEPAPTMVVPPGTIRPAVPPSAQVTALQEQNKAPPAPAPEAVAAPPPSSTSKLLAAALGGTVLLGGVAVGLWKTVLQPTSLVTVTVSGPTESTVRFDELPAAKAAPTATFQKVEKGNHMVVVEAPGYVAMTIPLVANGEPVIPLTPALKRISGKLLVVSDPSGATITLDGKPTDKQTPATFELEVDSVHEVRLSKPDYKEVVKAPIRIVANQETVEKLSLLPSVVRIRIFSTPEGAGVKVGGIDMGVTPVAVERAPDDPYPQVIFTRQGCETVTTTVPFDREKAEDRYEVTLKCR